MHHKPRVCPLQWPASSTAFFVGLCLCLNCKVSLVACIELVLQALDAPMVHIGLVPYVGVIASIEFVFCTGL